ncbi:MAG: hypothetical protein ACRCUI_01875 [Polymorphobacter sp.]
MSRFWRNWFTAFCLSLLVFGLVLAGGAFAATTPPVDFLLVLLGGNPDIAWTAPLRFCSAVLGAVTIGWGVTLYFMIPAAIDLQERGRPFWNAITAGTVSWFVIDSALSVATGFGLNAIPNMVLAGIYLVGLYGSGARRR